MNKKILSTIVALYLLVFYFSGVGFRFGILEQAAAAIAAFALLYIAGKGGWQRFYLVSLSSFTSALSFGCAFLNPTDATGPLVTGFRMSPFVILLLSVVVGVLVLLWDRASKSKNKFATILFCVFVFNWVVLAFNVRFYDDWKMENWLTVPFVILIYITHRWFRLSNASFGFLFAYPLREMTIRISDAKGFWAFWFPVEFVLAFYAIYELMEWAVAVVFGGDLGIAYLGTQGDIWDAQKDILNAGVGAMIAMFVVFLIVWYYRRREFWNEFWNSLRVKNKKALGEEALREFESER